MRYFLKLSYNGKNYHGWQSQPNAVTVQSVVEKALSTICRTTVEITGAGRTDAGVHARTMYAHFDIDEPVLDPKRFLLSLNRLCGKDITLEEVVPVTADAHARFDASERSYKYFVSFRKTPFLYDFSWLSPSRLDMDAMNEAATLLLTTRDFTSFAKLHSDARTNLCDVRQAIWTPLGDDPESSSFLGSLDDGIVFTIKADRFLRNMVRAVVGTLVEVGRHKLSREGFLDIINGKNRSLAGISMPSQALFLWDIKYPDHIFNPK